MHGTQTDHLLYDYIGMLITIFSIKSFMNGKIEQYSYVPCLCLCINDMAYKSAIQYRTSI